MNQTQTGNSQSVLQFYDKVIRDYNCGDVKWLLKRRAPTLGPLLACIGAGIETIGGMLFGFNMGSKERSVRFLMEIMELDKPIAMVVYQCARCGYVHEGIGKRALSWFADYERVKKKCIVFGRDDGGLALNVVELAYEYLATVDVISKHKLSDLRHLPLDDQRDKPAFESLSAITLPNVSEIINAYSERLDRVRGSHSQEDILRGINYWAFDGYNRKEA